MVRALAVVAPGSLPAQSGHHSGGLEGFSAEGIIPKRDLPCEGCGSVAGSRTGHLKCASCAPGLHPVRTAPTSCSGCVAFSRACSERSAQSRGGSCHTHPELCQWRGDRVAGDMRPMRAGYHTLTHGVSPAVRMQLAALRWWASTSRSSNVNALLASGSSAKWEGVLYML
jgi:hypothetical protein